MKRKDWEHLCSLSLGMIVFASPKNPKAKSLPALINKADIDGNRIFSFGTKKFLIVWVICPLVRSVCFEQGDRHQFTLELLLYFATTSVPM